MFVHSGYIGFAQGIKRAGFKSFRAIAAKYARDVREQQQASEGFVQATRVENSSQNLKIEVHPMFSSAI